MGNIKEALIPYFQKEFKLAMMSFDLYGAVTPSDESAKSKKDDDFNADQMTKVKKERTVTQAELESSAPPVRNAKYKYFQIHTHHEFFFSVRGYI